MQKGAYNSLEGHGASERLHLFLLHLKTCWAEITLFSLEVQLAVAVVPGTQWQHGGYMKSTALAGAGKLPVAEEG